MLELIREHRNQYAVYTAGLCQRAEMCHREAHLQGNMETEQLKQAVQFIKAGNKQAALPILKQVLQADPSNESAWLWLYSCVNHRSEKKYCLQKALAINPNNTKAREALEKLTSVDPVIPRPASSSSPEKTYYQQDPVLVTSHRIVFGGKTHALRDINSASGVKVPPNRGTGRIIALGCFFVMICSAWPTFGTSGVPSDFTLIFMLFGSAGTVIGLVISFLAKPLYVVRLVSGSGEIDEYISKDEQEVTNIVSAINNAIVEKG